MTLLRGITWAHRRAVDPLNGTLAGFRDERPDISVVWEARSLHGFEFQSLPELASRYDLIILDHPFCGEIAASGCLLPQDELDGCDGLFVGPSLATYHYAGRHWALPVDAASQVAVYRPDLLSRLGETAPETWDEVLHLGERARPLGLRLAIGLRGVHSLMTFYYLCANLGRPGGGDGAEFADPAVAREALAALRALLAYCPAASLDWNSIDLHDALAAEADLVYCPVVYCYATYAEADRANPLRFSDLPGLGRRSPAGSAIGGTGLGISASCADPDAAFAYARYLMRADVQNAFALHHGQPARVSAWENPGIDDRFAGTFSRTRRSIELAWIRPRYPGYLQFQARAGDLVEGHLRGDLAEGGLLAALEALHREHSGAA